MSVFFIIVGLILLVVGGEFLVRSSVALSFKFNISKMVIGLTVVSFATSAPELLVSLQAAMDGYASISLGNVIGSNIANIGLVLGITAILGSLYVERDFFTMHWPSMVFFSGLLYLFLANDQVLSFFEGGILLAAIVVFLVILIRNAKRSSLVGEEKISDEVDEDLESVSYFKIGMWLLIGAVSLYFGSELLVKGAVDLAKLMGVSERVIAVTMIAVGTSVPELAASVIAVMKQEKSISIGNLIGSNIFNIGSVLGITALVQPIKVDSVEILSNDIFWMLGFALVLLPITLLPNRNEINRLKGGVIFLGYITFLMVTFLA
ncbi:calcium/sodium antiporter [Aquimarina agarivorans]|uniref:calcium/sodium antiporter n=1 Tax=Aquimarina agarivorans TaxID=980584 RepID=UPI000248F925|nr:calcium/sodium antiporter [Aquimarina agarivorans]